MLDKQALVNGSFTNSLFAGPRGRKSAAPMRTPSLCRFTSWCSTGRQLLMGIYKADKEHTELGQDKYSEIYLQKSLLALKPKTLISNPTTFS